MFCICSVTHNRKSQARKCALILNKGMNPHQFSMNNAALSAVAKLTQAR